VKNRLAWMFVSVVSFALSSSGCHITTCEHGSVCGVDDERAREDACRSLCDRLVVCGNVAGSDHDACMSTCFDDYDRAPSSTANGCACASRASCTEIAERQCPGAPPIGGGYGSGSTTSGSTTGSGSVAVGATVTGSGAGGRSGSTSSSTTSSTTSSSGGQPGSGGAPGHAGSGGTPGASDGGPATCGD
jgi:hypothetical protein